MILYDTVLHFDFVTGVDLGPSTGQANLICMTTRNNEKIAYFTTVASVASQCWSFWWGYWINTVLYCTTVVVIDQDHTKIVVITKSMTILL